MILAFLVTLQGYKEEGPKQDCLQRDTEAPLLLPLELLDDGWQAICQAWSYYSWRTMASWKLTHSKKSTKQTEEGLCETKWKGNLGVLFPESWKQQEWSSLEELAVSKCSESPDKFDGFLVSTTSQHGKRLYGFSGRLPFGQHYMGYTLVWRGA